MHHTIQREETEVVNIFNPVLAFIRNSNFPDLDPWPAEQTIAPTPPHIQAAGEAYRTCGLAIDSTDGTLETSL